MFTLRYQIGRIWNRAATAVAAYEQQPDAGLLPPTAARLLYRVLHWGVVFGGCSFLLVLGYLAVCGLASCLSLLMALSAVVWMPVVCVLHCLFTVLVYDLDSPEAPDASQPDWLTLSFWGHCCRCVLGTIRRRGWALLSIDSLRNACSSAVARLPFLRSGRFGVWRARSEQPALPNASSTSSSPSISMPRNRVAIIGELLFVLLLLRCLLEPLAAIVLGVFIHPLLCAFNLAFGVVRYCFRVVFDGVMFIAVIKPFGRVPANETWMSKRVAGKCSAYIQYSLYSPKCIVVYCMYCTI